MGARVTQCCFFGSGNSSTFTSITAQASDGPSSLILLNNRHTFSPALERHWSALHHHELEEVYAIYSSTQSEVFQPSNLLHMYESSL